MTKPASFAAFRTEVPQHLRRNLGQRPIGIQCGRGRSEIAFVSIARAAKQYGCALSGLPQADGEPIASLPKVRLALKSKGVAAKTRLYHIPSNAGCVWFLLNNLTINKPKGRK